MSQIEPVDFGTTGPKVTNLHEGLLFLIDHQGYSPHDVQVLRDRIADDVTHNLCGEATRMQVSIQQYQLKHWPNTWPSFAKEKDIVDAVRSISDACTGAVDGPTAKALNWVVEAFRRVESPPPLPADLQPDAILQMLQGPSA